MLRLITLTALSCCIVSTAYAEDIPFFIKFPHIHKKHWYLSSGWSNGAHQSCEWRKELIEGVDGKLKLTLTDQHYGRVDTIGCAEIQSTKKYSYGRYETRMKAAYGSGLNTAFFTYTGPPHGVKEHDEIDFEFLGKENNLLQVGYWQNGINHETSFIELGYNASEEFHTYAFDWFPDKIIWYVDGEEVYRTTGKNPLPTNAQKLYFSLWSGGKGTKDWLGKFEYEAPKSAEIEWVSFTPHSQPN